MSGRSNDGDDDLTCRKDSFLFVREGREGVRRHHEPFSGVGDSTWSSLVFIVHGDVFDDDCGDVFCDADVDDNIDDIWNISKVDNNIIINTIIISRSHLSPNTSSLSIMPL